HAQELLRRLSLDGFVLPAEERVAAAAGKREVRYYHAEDRGAAEALQSSTAAALADLGIEAEPEVAIVDLTGWKGRKPQPGVLELWVEFPPDRGQMILRK